MLQSILQSTPQILIDCGPELKKFIVHASYLSFFFSLVWYCFFVDLPLCIMLFLTLPRLFPLRWHHMDSSPALVMKATLTPIAFVRTKKRATMNKMENTQLLTLLTIGPLVARAALYTAGVVGRLKLKVRAACAPSQKYLNIRLVMAHSLLGHIDNTYWQAKMNYFIFLFKKRFVCFAYSWVYMQSTLYEGLILYGSYLLCDTQSF